MEEAGMADMSSQNLSHTEGPDRRLGKVRNLLSYSY